MVIRVGWNDRWQPKSHSATQTFCVGCKDKRVGGVSSPPTKQNTPKSVQKWPAASQVPFPDMGGKARSSHRTAHQLEEEMRKQGSEPVVAVGGNRIGQSEEEGLRE
jgi:hypothetical protein